MNESLPYVEATHRMYGGQYGQGPGPGENLPAWLVFDQEYRNRYIFAGLQPGQKIPSKWIESGVIVKADTIEELAKKANLPSRSYAPPSSDSTVSPAAVSTRTSAAARARTTATTVTPPTSPTPTSAR